MIVVIWRKVSSKWKTIGAKRILFYSWSCTKAFASTSRKNSLNDLGGQFAFWFCSFDNGKASLALPQEKYQKLFHVNIKAFEALSFLIFFLQKSKKWHFFAFTRDGKIVGDFEIRFGFGQYFFSDTIYS